MFIKKFIKEADYYDEERGPESIGHWEEVDLSAEQVKEAVTDFLWYNCFKKPGVELKDCTDFIDNVYAELQQVCDVEEAYKDTIAEYFGGRA